MGFEPTISASERPQTYALDRAAPGTGNLFVIANVKQLRTGGNFRIFLPFFRTSWGVDALNSTIFNGFHSRVEFCTITEGLRNFGGWGGV